MSYENDDDIDVLNELPSAHAQDYSKMSSQSLQRFHITTGEVPDAGSQHALKTANEALKSRLVAVTEDYEQLKANHRLLLRKSQKQHIGGSQSSCSLPGMHSSGLGESLVSKGSAMSTDEGFVTGGSNASNLNSDHKVKEMESYYVRQNAELTKQIAKYERQTKELTNQLTDLQNENYRLISQVSELKKHTANEDCEKLKNQNSSLEDRNEQLLKEKAALEKKFSSTKKDLIGLNKDYSECKQDKEQLERLVKTQGEELSAVRSRLAVCEQDLVQSRGEVRHLKAVQRDRGSSLQSNVNPAARQNDDFFYMQVKNALAQLVKSMEVLRTDTLRHQSILKKWTSREMQKRSSFSARVPSQEKLSDIDDAFYDDDVRWPDVSAAEDENIGHKTEKPSVRTDRSADGDYIRDVEDYITSIPKSRDVSLSVLRRPDGKCDVAAFGDDKWDYGTATHHEKLGVSLHGYAVGQVTDTEADQLPQDMRKRSDSPRVCPSCHVSFPGSMSKEEFQLHILDCDPSEEIDLNRAKELDRVCPMCNAVYPATVSQIEYEQHVMHHFDNENGGDFVVP